MRAALILSLVCFIAPMALSEDAALSGGAAKLYKQAIETGRFSPGAAKEKPEVRPTSDGKSFFVVWKGLPAPKRWIFSLHGAGRPAKGFATDDFSVWLPHLKGRDVGLVCLQWWLGTGDGARDFYTPQEIYHEADIALKGLGVAPGTVMLHGFSRGSSNCYAATALDAGKGRHYFSVTVASSGGASFDYPPNRALIAGAFGEKPLKGTRWITAAGGRDPSAERDGIPGMERTAVWLKEQGAILVDSIADPAFGHGALHTNPQNIKRVLDAFLK